MGYTTEFDGGITIDPPLNDSEWTFLEDLCNTRRMDRTKGPLFVKGGGFAGQAQEPDITDYNDPHPDQPGLWCHWTPANEGHELEWDGGEKFYHSAEWMKYIVTNLLAPSGREYVTRHLDEDERLKDFTFDHTLNGVIEAQGEDPSDKWRLVVIDNRVTTQTADFSYGPLQDV